MSERSTIEWTQATWNPVTGCSKVSPGCAHCYAETFAERFRGVAGHPYTQGFDLTLRHDRLMLPLQWRQPRLIFVNSMSDLFHEDVPYTFVRHVFDVMEQASQHRFQLLTKRARRLVELAPHLRWPANVWMGVSIENRQFAGRASELRQVPAAVRFISAEPLLGPLDDLSLQGIDWLIVGGESGPGARPMHPEWVRSLRDRCANASVPFYFKQWGAYRPLEGRSEAPGSSVTSIDVRGHRQHGSTTVGRSARVVLMRRVGKHRAGRLLDGREWSQMPASARLGSGSDARGGAAG